MDHVERLTTLARLGEAVLQLVKESGLLAKRRGPKRRRQKAVVAAKATPEEGKPKRRRGRPRKAVITAPQPENVTETADGFEDDWDDEQGDEADQAE